MDLQNLDRALLKSVRVEDPHTGAKTPRVLMSRELGGSFQKGDVLDANATAILIEEISGSGTHGDVKKYCDEQIALIRADMGVANGFATLDAKGNVPLTQLGNVDTELYVIVSSLPSKGKTNKIYLVKDATSEKDDNKYYEWAYIDNKWEKVGEIHEDITGYLKKTQSANDVNKGAILDGGTLADPIAKDVTYTAPLFTGTDNVFGKGAGYVPLTSGRAVVGNGYYLTSGAYLNSTELKFADGTILNPNALSFSNNTILNNNGFYLKGYGDYKTYFSYDGIYLSNNYTKLHSSLVLGSTYMPGIMWAETDMVTEKVSLRYNNGYVGLSINTKYTPKDYNESLTTPNWSDTLLTLNKHYGFYSGGIYIKDKTRNDLLNGGGFTTHIGSTDDTTIYHNVAPLVQDTTDTTKWYVPAKYMNWDVQIDGESIVDADTQIANIDYLKKGDQILIKADTDTVHAIVTNGKVDLGDSNAVGTSKQAAIGSENTLAADKGYAYALGYNNNVSGGYTTVVGIRNTDSKPSVSGYKAIFGCDNTSSGHSGLIAGIDNNVTNDYNYVIGAGNVVKTHDSTIVGLANTSDSGFSDNVFGRGNTLKGSAHNVVGYKNVVGGGTTVVLGYNNNVTTNSIIATYNNAIGCCNVITSDRVTACGFFLKAVNKYETALGHYNDSISGDTIFSVGNGYYDEDNKLTYRHNLIKANRDGDFYIVEKTNTDGDTTNFYERPMKRLQTWLNEKVDIANIGADDDTTAYTHVCPIVQDTVDTSKWIIPSRYLDATIQDAAFKSEANTFSKTNTFTDGTGNDVIVAANSVTVQSETNATIITSSGITNGAKTSKDLFNAVGDYAHIGTSADTADYTDVAPIKETSETYTPAGGTETTETNTIVPMDYMPKKLHVEDKVDEKSTQVVSSKAIYEAIPHIYIHDVSIAHGTNTKFFIYMQIMTLGDYDFSTVANIASWLKTNGYNSAINGHVVNGSTNGSYNNALTWFSTNGTTLQLMYETNSNYSYYTCDAQIKVYTHKRKLFNE